MQRFIEYILSNKNLYSSSLVEEVKTSVDMVKITCVIIMLFTLVIGLIILVIDIRKADYFKRSSKSEDNTMRVISINTQKSIVTYFNVGDMTNVREKTIDGWLDSFDDEDKIKVKNWIDSISNGEDVSDYIKCNVKLKKRKEVVPSFLLLTHSDATKGTIHLESYLLTKNMKIKPKPINFDNFITLDKALEEYGTDTGTTFCFILTEAVKDEKGNIIDQSYDVSDEASKRFCELISGCTTEKEMVIRLSKNEVVVVDMDINDIAAAVYYSNNIIEGIRNNLNSRSNLWTKGRTYELNCGIVLNKDVSTTKSRDYVEQSRYIAMELVKHNDNIKFYDKDQEPISDTNQIKYHSEVGDIIFEKKISYKYRPILDTNNLVETGYLLKCEPIDTGFESMEELKRYAFKANDEAVLFNFVAKNSILRFSSTQKDKGYKIYFPIDVDELDLAISFFSRNKKIESSLVNITLQNNDIVENVDQKDFEEFLEKINILKENGYTLALAIDSEDNVIDDNVFSEFDAFIVDFYTEDKVNMDAKIRSELHALVERLIKYKKPIIANNIMTWNALELVVGSGLVYISSDVIAKYDTMLLPVSKKRIDKIQQMINRK